MTRMSELFSGILSLSLTASYVIVVLLFIRFSMKKFPKIYSYLLWSVVGIKLVFPFSWKRIILFFYKYLNGSLVSKEAMETMIPNVEIGNKVTEKIAVKFSPHYITMGMVIWLSGIVIFWAYTVFSIIKLKKSLKSAEEVEEGIYEGEDFILYRGKEMMMGISKKKDMEIKEKEKTIKRLEEVVERRSIKEYVDKVDIVIADGKKLR